MGTSQSHVDEHEHIQPALQVLQASLLQMLPRSIGCFS
jgi:hypothetical protein